MLLKFHYLNVGQYGSRYGAQANRQPNPGLYSYR